MNNHFPDRERAKTATNTNSPDIQGDGEICDVSIYRHRTQTSVNDSATSADADTRLTQLRSLGVLPIGTAGGHTILADERNRELLSRYSWRVVKSGSGHLKIKGCPSPPRDGGR